ncbi:hypothetical protein BD310DRAFT_838242 [Dichomitus squalens]|uniref:Uncharacterized protein n=1 Tax=Dichomitus squalens TaxID=114155 RepID=A0A4Q9QAW4_9APHY|nr:hypothetical protein BD310DRAFT_838242 [Dichomitus squalens]
MASTEPTTSASHSEDRLDANHTDLKPTKDLTAAADGASDAGTGPAGRSRDASPASHSSASGLSSNKGGTQSPAPSGSASTPPLGMPHPKKFSHVNINKKFLEKTSSASTPTHTLPASSTSKAANPSQKSVPQTTTPHPRLVTAKLTAMPQPSSTSGWSRPSSAVPSVAPTPTPASNLKTSSGPATSSTLASVPPPGGKVIQPQPRNSQDTLFTKKDASGKPVWGNAKGGALTPLSRAQADFPTAAEVAQGRIAKLSDKTAANEATAQKQAAEADTFRGVHLDPNAHHWDEMEEDDDNFLDGVIEFGDGRQYKVQPSDAPRATSSPKDAAKSLPPEDAHLSGLSGAPEHPVSKEDRFADDFDRSWPRSRPGNQTASMSREQRSNGTATSPSSTSVHSPQETSRQLFNERSNRLEPYSHQRHGGPGGPSHFNRRGSRSDYLISPTEVRRDAPPHTHSQGVHLLQKDPNGSAADSPTFSRAPGDRPPLSPADSRFRDRQSGRRDHPPWQGDGPPGSGHGRNGPYSAPHPPARPRDAPFEDRRGSSGHEQFSAASGVDNRRQLPPHLSAPPPRNVPPPRTESDVPIASPVPLPSSLPHTEPPAPSATSQAAESPVAEQPTVPAVDVEEVRKAAMHSAAERARLRRQQEEEEREREKERARKKAAEIEERMKAMEQEKAREREKAEAEKQKADAQVLGIIEEAVSSLNPPEKKANGLSEDQRSTPAPPTFGRSTSARGTSRILPSRRTSFGGAVAAASGTPTAPSPASEADTWRRKGPLPPLAPSAVKSVSQELLAEPAPPVLPSPVLAHTALEVKDGEEVDVVDYADFGKLVGSEEQSQPPVVGPTARPPRAVAADFFTEEPVDNHRPQPPSPKADEGPWRRRPSFGNGPPPHVEKPPFGDSMRDPAHVTHEPHQPIEHAGTTSVAPGPASHEEHHRRLSGQHQNGNNKLALGPHYREAPMSTLNDVMARIKGAIDGMHHDGEAPNEASKEIPREAPKPTKWLPPALRPRTAISELPRPSETFDVTSTEPPKSPKKAWNIYTVKLAAVSRPVAPEPTTELVWPRNAPRYLRLDVYSWNPPIDSRYRRGSTVNDVIFGGPHYFKGQPKYDVLLPRQTITRREQSHAIEKTPASPVVNLPTTPPRMRSTITKETAGPNWRKAPISPLASWRPLPKDTTQDVGLDTVSRSPPPETPSAKQPPLPPADAAVPSAVSSTSASAKMPVGSNVGFYRTAAEPQAQVQFIVTSELDGDAKAKNVTPEPKIAIGETQPALQLETKVDGAASIAVNGLPTPPQQAPSLASQWSKSPKVFGLKESPSRAPDPEHLKAVWSQTSDKAQNQPINSLKGIADDLTGVPFSLQDVKPDDSETPPSSVAGAWTRSKMSSYDVTRAFQQVPSSSASSSQPRPAPIAPTVSTSSSTNGSAPRYPGFAFSPPPVGQPSFHPPSAYPAYSPMMSHAASPTVVYSHPSPVPRPMVVNGQAPPNYGQPVWMPSMASPAPPSSRVMRSPYPAQLVPYPSPGGTMPGYPSPVPGMQHHHPPPQQNGAQGRPPGMPLMSPVMQHAMPPMYASSPVLVHTSPHAAPGQAYPTPGQPPRAPMHQHPNPGTPHMHHPQMRPPPQNGYAPVPSGYVAHAPRPTW